MLQPMRYQSPWDEAAILLQFSYQAVMCVSIPDATFQAGWLANSAPGHGPSALAVETCICLLEYQNFTPPSGISRPLISFAQACKGN